MLSESGNKRHDPARVETPKVDDEGRMAFTKVQLHEGSSRYPKITTVTLMMSRWSDGEQLRDQRSFREIYNFALDLGL
jgi:hypothetical protein